MSRNKKNSASMKRMCERLALVLRHVYAGDVKALSDAMGYSYQTTLRKALTTHTTFPDLERFNTLMETPARGCIVPNLNWLVNGVENPLLHIAGDKVVAQITFGEYVDKFSSQRKGSG
jgi:hypothetical protein